MGRFNLIMAIIELVKLVLKDSDGDGRIDIADSDPKNPEVK